MQISPRIFHIQSPNLPSASSNKNSQALQQDDDYNRSTDATASRTHAPGHHRKPDRQAAARRRRWSAPHHLGTSLHHSLLLDPNACQTLTGPPVGTPDDLRARQVHLPGREHAHRSGGPHHRGRRRAWTILGSAAHLQAEGLPTQAELHLPRR